MSKQLRTFPCWSVDLSEHDDCANAERCECACHDIPVHETFLWNHAYEWAKHAGFMADAVSYAYWYCETHPNMVAPHPIAFKEWVRR